ncbi:MAG: valine--tRNA ligase [Rhodospirillales bacterium]|nr:valine--tRNA ligase [Rhodospirillales bacterium]
MLEKTYRPEAVESEAYRLWDQEGAFAATPDHDVERFVIVIPPPNVTGKLHIGHALNNTMQDVLIRYHRMKGEDALWMPGMDHAGIATQMVVERSLYKEGKSRYDLGREAFVERVWDWTRQSGEAIRGQLRALGAGLDWARERFTLDDGLSEAVRTVFVKLYKEKLIYKDKRLVNWDPKLCTAISDLEVQQRETGGSLWHFRYPLEDEPDRYVVVATTRPETMLGDTAVAVHPEDLRYRDLIGRKVLPPLMERAIPLVADDYADPKTGSGAVKITPAHDFNDFEVGLRHDLPIINIFDETAQLNDRVPEAYRGLDRFAARKRVVADIEALGLLEKIEPHRHMVPHGDRSGVPIEPFLTEQWYLDAEILAKPAIAAVEEGRTAFHPKQWENTYFEWMRNIQPWCISRQLWWGHRIPAWYGPDGACFVEMTEAEAQAAAKAHYGEAAVLTRDPDVLDTWFSSALWPFSTLGWPSEDPGTPADLERYYPGSVLVTGFDIIFFWVARMMMFGLRFMGEVPFRDVVIHGLVRDRHGKKMSKSSGNAMDPMQLIRQYGCDAMRFTLLALAVPGRDVKLAPARLEGYRNFATKIWNAARFAEMNRATQVALTDFDPAKVESPVNRWIVGKAVEAHQALARALADYRFDEAAHNAFHFVWHCLCDWYIELAKPLLAEEAGASETRATLAWSLEQTLLLLHPMMPSLTEILWQQLGFASAGSLVSQRLPDDDSTLKDAAADAEIEWLIRLIGEVRTLRSEMKVPPGAQLELLLSDAGEATRRRIAAQQEPVRRLARLARFEAVDRALPKGAAIFVIGEATAAIPLAGVIDLAAERSRLKKEVGKLEQELGKLERKLGNADFLAKAPEEVVEENRERLADMSGRKARLSDALARLSA